MDVQEILGELIKRRRLSLGYSLRAFCIKHAIDPKYWSDLEHGKISLNRKDDGNLRNDIWSLLQLGVSEADKETCDA